MNENGEQTEDELWLSEDVLPLQAVSFEQLQLMQSAVERGLAEKFDRDIQFLFQAVIRDRLSRVPFRVFWGSATGAEKQLDKLRSAWTEFARRHLIHRRKTNGDGESLWPACILDREAKTIHFIWQSAQKKRSPKQASKQDGHDDEPQDQPDNSANGGQTVNSVLEHNLPVELTPFRGRISERTRISELLAIERLVTLTGVGGAGKTRLAHQIGLDLLNRYPDGVRRVELVSVVDSHLVPRVVADSIDLPGDVSDSSLMERITQRLRSRKLLLILNNCDHLIKACAETAERVLHGCPDVRMLATSRRELFVQGEWVVPIQPLDLPAKDVDYSIQELLQFGAIQLFIDRASGGGSSFELTESNALAVINICRKLDGIPMFIVFAATRVKCGDSPEAVWESLRDVFRALRHGSTTATSKDQTARALIDWSYDLLSDEEQRVFRALSVFRGGWTKEAAFAVCAKIGLRESEFHDIHRNLVRKSVVDRQPVIDGEERFKLLEPLREYAADKLLGTSELKDFHERHLRYFILRAKRSEQDVGSPKQRTQLKEMERELDNLRSAFDWSQSDGDTIDEGLELASTLKWFWTASGRVPEATRRLHDLLGHPAAQGYFIERAKGWIAAVSLHPFFEGLGGPISPADRPRIRESLFIAEKLGDLQVQAEALDCLAAMAQSELKWKEANELRDRALKLWRRIGSVRGQCNSMLGMMRCMGATFDPASVRELGHECLQLAQKAKDDEAEAATLTQLALEAKDSGRYPEMRGYWKQMLVVERRRGACTSYYHAFTELVRTYLDDENGEIRRAVLGEHLPQAESFFDEMRISAIQDQNHQRHATSLLYLGFCRRYRGEAADAQRLFEQAADLWRKCRGEVDIGVLLLATFEFLKGDDHLVAEQMIQECIEAAQALNNLDALRWSTNMRGLLDSQLGRHESAIKRISEALEMARREGHLGTIIFTLYLLANEQIHCNRLDDAELASKEMATLSASHDDRGWIGTSRLLSGTLELACKQSSAARKRFHDSLDVFLDNGRVHDVRVSIQAIGQCDVLDGNFARAAKVFGAADRPLHVDWRWASNPLFENFQEQAHKALGDTAFAKAYKAGLAMTLKESIDYAR